MADWIQSGILSFLFESWNREDRWGSWTANILNHGGKCAGILSIRSISRHCSGMAIRAQSIGTKENQNPQLTTVLLLSKHHLNLQSCSNLLLSHSSPRPPPQYWPPTPSHWRTSAPLVSRFGLIALTALSHTWAPCTLQRIRGILTGSWLDRLATSQGPLALERLST